MRHELLDFINGKSFPCIMAKAVANHGLLKVHVLEDLEKPDSVASVLEAVYRFVDSFRQARNELCSFALIIPNDEYQSFQSFELVFWSFLSALNREDKKRHPHDERVSSNPDDDRFSFSLKSEAFFILALHPRSPRWARRFKYPAIIFNPHAQFEKLREKGVFTKVRDMIRFKDRLLQGSINPMLNDFGDKSEVFQYMGKIYGPTEKVPLNI